MKRLIIIALVPSVLVLSQLFACAAESNSVKLTPFGVDYPLIRLTPYRSPEGDPYGRTFGIRRWFVAAGAEMADLERTYQESNEMFDLYGGYGVLGHGEEVFTGAAARWRKAHRGR
jgi:hypothetical protein